MKATGGWNLAVGDEIGRVFLLKPESVTYRAALVTLGNLYRFESRAWDEKPTAVCAWCGCRFEGESKAVDAIMCISRGSGLLSSDSPCTAMPVEAWDEPRMCASCQSWLISRRMESNGMRSTQR